MKRLLAIAAVLFVSGCSSPSPTTSPAPTASVTAPKPPDEAAAIRALGDINKAQEGYNQRNRRYALTYDELIESHFLKVEPSKESIGYEIKLRPSADAASYAVIASPVASPARHFFTDKTGTIRAEANGDATASSPPIS